MNLRMELLKSLEEINNTVKERCREIMQWKNKNCNENYHANSDISAIDYDGDEVTITVEEYLAYGGYDTHYYSFPFTEIINDDWHEAYLENYKRSCEEKLQKKLESKKIAAQKKEAAEREEYERLKKKFE